MRDGVKPLVSFGGSKRSSASPPTLVSTCLISQHSPSCILPVHMHRPEQPLYQSHAPAPAAPAVQVPKEMGRLARSHTDVSILFMDIVGGLLLGQMECASSKQKGEHTSEFQL